MILLLFIYVRAASQSLERFLFLNSFCLCQHQFLFKDTLELFLTAQKERKKIQNRGKSMTIRTWGGENLSRRIGIALVDIFPLNEIWLRELCGGRDFWGFDGLFLSADLRTSHSSEINENSTSSQKNGNVSKNVVGIRLAAFALWNCWSMVSYERSFAYTLQTCHTFPR